MTMTQSFAPSVRRGPLMRYKTLWEGPNQGPVNAMQAWERVLRAQAAGDGTVGNEPITKRADLLKVPTEQDPELEELTLSFHKLQTQIRATLSAEAAQPIDTMPSIAEGSSPIGARSSTLISEPRSRT